MKETAERIEKSDLNSVISSHLGNKLFKEALEKAADKRDLLRIVGRYIHFNSVFGGGVANLAGEIAVRREMFKDTYEDISAIQDRSDIIAASIFFAAIDEFGDHSTPNRFTHRALAQATLRGFSEYFDIEPAEVDELMKPNHEIEESIEMVKEGYLLNQKIDERKIFKAIGFHMGSEILADEEFRILDGFLKEKHPELITRFKKEWVKVGDSKLPAYAWIQIHTSVEADHFEAAAKSATAALRYYQGKDSKSMAKSRILYGFREFAYVQGVFMENLTRD